jgi:mannose-6-phosphate isomerase-like protein (cupin superfamily)
VGETPDQDRTEILAIVGPMLIAALRRTHPASVQASANLEPYRNRIHDWVGKRIGVKPGASLSLQKHHHRAEHWIVVAGTAEVTRGSETFLLSENQSTYIPIGEVHRLKNPGKVYLEMIEVQSGGYLGEDDIVRLEDTYGRAS